MGGEEEKDGRRVGRRVSVRETIAPIGSARSSGGGGAREAVFARSPGTAERPLICSAQKTLRRVRSTCALLPPILCSLAPSPVPFTCTPVETSRQLPQQDENDVSMPIPEAIIGAVDWREYCWYQAVQAACAETLAQVYDQWLIDSLNLEQISVLTALSSAIARLPLALFSVPSGAPIPPLALVVSIDAFVAWGRPIFDFASKDGKFGSDRRISAVVHCYNTALSLTPSRSVLPPLKEDIFSELVNRATHREIWAKSKLKRSSESYEAFTSQWLQSGVKNSGICSSSAQKDFISVILADELSEACS
uniref:Uncharacterized protein n=1 Tax=Plectus sambesii TaxID=2011161 RepID=A0A914W8T2_9BILA